MKKIVILLLLSFFSIEGSSQNKRRVVSVELGAGVLYSFDKEGFNTVYPGGVLYGEVRYNLKQLPLDFGLSASAQIFSRKFNKGEGLDYLSKNIMVVADYYFYNHGWFNAFVGFGAGIGFFDNLQDVEYKGEGTYVWSQNQKAPLCFMPRVGLEFINHFRVSLGYIFEDHANRNLFLRVGYIF